jgi:hypothetical protein
MRLVVDADWRCTHVLRLAGVSQFWKAVAERCGLLWHKLSISQPGDTGSWSRLDDTGTHLTSIQSIKKWLELSRNVPLDIYIRFPAIQDTWSRGKTSPPQVYDIFREVMLHSHRWRVATLLVDADCQSAINDRDHDMCCIHQVGRQMVKYGCLRSAHLLEELDIRQTSTCPSYTNNHFVLHAQTASFDIQHGSFRLRKLRFDAFTLAFPSMTLENITSLSVGDTCGHNQAFTMTLDMIRQCPVLSDLTVRRLIYREVGSSPTQLQYLKVIRFIDIPRLDIAFRWFSAPALETIEVLSEQSSSPGSLSYESFCTLTGSPEAISQLCHIDVSGAKVTNRDLQRLLAQCVLAKRVAFSAGARDETRTSILRDIRVSLPRRLVAVGGESIHITVARFAPSRNARSPLMDEWGLLQKLSTSWSDDGDFIFHSSRSRRW